MIARRDPRSIAVAFGLWLCATLAASATVAQSSPRSPGPEPAAEVSEELAELEHKLQEARTRLEEWQVQASEYLLAGQQAQARTQAIDEDIARLQQRESISAPKDATIDQLNVALLDAEQDLAAARREAIDLDVEADRRAERRKRIPVLLSIAKQRIKELEDAPPAPSGATAVAEAARELVTLKRAASRTEIEAYQSELGTYDVRGVLLSKQRDRATFGIAYYEALAAKLRDAKQGRERLEVEQENEATKKLLEELTALPDGFKRTLDELYQRNEALASVRTSEGGLHEQIEDVSKKLTRAEAKVADLEAELTRLAARVQAVGLADSVGALLRRHRAEAPDIGMYRRFIRMRQQQIGDVQLQQIKLREQRQALADIDARVEEAMGSIEDPMDPDARAELEPLLRQLFGTQRRYMDALIEDYETYFQKLIDFDTQQQELIARTKDLLDFIDERILWIPSGQTIQPELLSDGRDAVAWLLRPRFWAQLGRGFRDAATRLWPVNLLALLLAIFFFPFARRVRPRIQSLGEQARMPNCVRFAPTSEALALTMLLAIWLPAVLAYVGWRLGLSPVATQYTRSIAHGLFAAAVVWGMLRVARQLVRPGGVAEAHCGWSRQAAHALWRNLRWLTLVTVPAVFVIFVFEMRGEDLWRESVGRLAFSISMLGVGAFNYFALRSGGPLAEVLQARKRPPWAWRALQVSSWIAPLLLVAAALRGFYWTALQMGTRLHLNLTFVFLLMIALQLAARWSMIARRRAADEAEVPEEMPAGPVSTMEVSRLMLGTGVLLAILATLAIWADLLPAARILQQVELWTTTETVTVSQLDPSGVERVTTEDQLVAITLADLFRSLLVGLLTLALIRALPGILEATLFRRLGPGERYAYSTIVKYAVVLVGVAVAFDAIGVGWSSIQWLVAAVGLGLGFGLQEIFANFISGLIILFERPIRVGDTVSVGEVSGTVSRIRIRATWITAFDRKELIVPNKEFVTGRLINWTLSDAVLRTTIEVGVAYGSDTNRVIEVLKRIARDSPRVLRDPPPQVFFLGFGDSSLSFELRAFIRTAEQLFPVRHELHMSVDQAFREAGIEIAFPQRDLHLRSVPDDWVRPPGRSE
jgi:potassium efflux system protein